MNRMSSEGTPHPGPADGYPRWMRRSFRTRRMPVGKPGVSPRAGIRCPVGALRTNSQDNSKSNPSSCPCPTRPIPAQPSHQLRSRQIRRSAFHRFSRSSATGSSWHENWHGCLVPPPEDLIPYAGIWAFPFLTPWRPQDLALYRFRPNGAVHTSPGCNPGWMVDESDAF